MYDVYLCSVYTYICYYIMKKKMGQQGGLPHININNIAISK